MSQAISSRTKLGYKHYVCFPNDGRRHEVIGGDHYVNPAPSTNHQRCSGRIYFQLFDQIEELGLGEVFAAPTDVQLTEHDIVQPDLVIVMRERRLIITPIKIKGTPNLIVEILSSSTEQNDRVLKKELYERVGVPEYWIVSPDEHSVDQFVLSDGRFQLGGTHSEGISAAAIENLRVDLTKVW